MHWCIRLLFKKSFILLYLCEHWKSYLNHLQCTIASVEQHHIVKFLTAYSYAVNGSKIVMRHYSVMVPSLLPRVHNNKDVLLLLLIVFFYYIDSGYVWQWFTSLCTAILLVCIAHILLVAYNQFLSVAINYSTFCIYSVVRVETKSNHLDYLGHFFMDIVSLIYTLYLKDTVISSNY